jgi:quinol monooxygenase YgiN
MFNAKVERLMLGEVEELWDAVAIAMYPSRQAMIEMMQSDAYQAIHHHREAGLAGQLNIETTHAVGLWLGATGFKMAEPD